MVVLIWFIFGRGYRLPKICDVFFREQIMKFKLITSSALAVLAATLQGGCTAPTDAQSSYSERAVKPVQFVDFQYGPNTESSEKMLTTAKGRSVVDLIQEHGYPNDTHKIGDTTIYRWKAGNYKRKDSDMVQVQHFELLAYANSDGIINNINLKKIRDQALPSDFISVAPMP